MVEWINLHQAWAWIAFRDAEAIERITTASQKSAETMYDEKGNARLGGRGFVTTNADAELNNALQRGRLKAWRLDAERSIQIEPIAWTRVPSWRAPDGVLVSRRDVKRLWPVTPAPSRSHAGQTKVRKLFERAARERPGLSDYAYWIELQAVLGKDAPSESSLKRWVKKWRTEMDL